MKSQGLEQRVEGPTMHLGISVRNHTDCPFGLLFGDQLSEVSESVSVRAYERVRASGKN